MKCLKKKPQAEHYRLVVFSGITPIHSIRVKVHADGSGETIVKVAEKGTRKQGRNSLEKRQSRKVSTQETLDLKNSFKDLSFQDIYSDQTTNEDEVWLHPTLLCYEAAHNGRYNIVCDSTGNVTKITRTLLPKFYSLGGITSTASWSLYEYFRLDEIE